jgi:signal transduction histidine kinase
MAVRPAIDTRGFLVSRAGRGFLLFTLLYGVLSAGVGLAFYGSNLHWFKERTASEELTAIEMVEAFVFNYTNVRSSSLAGGAPVPATFRAHSIERFNNIRDPSRQLRLVWVGIPERAIATAPLDPDMADLVRGFADGRNRKPETRLIAIAGQSLMRTAFPSAALQSACVDCHNELYPDRPQWRLNDIMGAFVADVPAEQFLLRNRSDSILAGTAVFIVGAVIAFYIFTLHFRRLATEIEGLERQRMAEGVESMSDGFALYDASDRLLLANSAFRRQQDMLETSADGGRLPGRAARAAVSAGEIQLGDTSWIRVDETRTPSGMKVVIETDISELKQREAELRMSRDEAEHANRTRSEFLAVVSHELRTPLNAVIGFSEMIRDALVGPLSKRYRDYANDIHRSGHHLLQLINEILDMSKLEAGKLELRLAPVDVSEVLNLCVRLVEKRASEKRIAIDLDSPAGLRQMADDQRMTQIVLNLLDNAIKYTPDGGRVKVSAGRAVDDKGGSIISISDTGIGIAADDIPRVLSPFGQVDNALTRRHAGTGLGLPLAKRLVELHGGRFDIVSKPDVGTTVTVRFPGRATMTVAQ